jgi:16S rRNA (adenine(1408)-N(1))-methyltransferase
VLAAAAAEPDRLVVGVDASAAAMAEASRRAGRRAERGGLANALFVVAAAETLPPELDGLADLVTVHFPWGSLLRGLLAADPAVLGGLVRTMRPEASLAMLVSSTARDTGAGAAPIREPDLAALADAYASFGLAMTRARPATAADVAASHSTWGKRLGAGGRRPAWLLGAELGKAGGGLVEAGRGRLQPGPGVGGGEPIGDVAQPVTTRGEVVQLRPVQRRRDGRAR